MLTIAAFQPSKNVSDIINLEFFNPPNYHFVTQGFNTSSQAIRVPSCCINPNWAPGASVAELHSLSVQSIRDGDLGDRLPSIWIQVDSFAKVFLSTILADLGQQDSVTALNSPHTLHYFSKNITRMAGPGYLFGVGREPLNGSVENWNPLLLAGPARVPYNETSGGNLTITPSSM